MSKPIPWVGIVRVTLGLALCAMVLREAGPWTALFALLTLAGSEARALHAHLEAKRLRRFEEARRQWRRNHAPCTREETAHGSE